ncbi:SIMPL domain-containing protein [Candidatus Parcubacteria bacterium]|nr:SIMPL domain-containing protein [Candidatus Parcubacteria bacterium]
MNTPFKPLIWAGSLVLVILAVFLLVQTNHVSNTAATSNTISFSGEGKVTAKPDIAAISASIVTQATDSKVAQDENSRKSKAVTDFLKKQNIDEKDIKTTGYNIYPQYRYPTYGGNPTTTGYQVVESYEIKVRDLNKVSTVLSGLVGAGANQVNNLGMQVENPEKLQAEARQKAIDAAKKKAQELESQVGVKLGRIVNFQENNGGYPVPMYLDAQKGGIGMGGGGPEPVISQGQNEIVINVSITYQIK